MMRSRLAGGVLPVAMVLVIVTASGCGIRGRGGNVATSASSPPPSTSQPSTSQPPGRPPIASVEPPGANLANNPVVEKTKSSVVKIEGATNSCNRLQGGSGFVVAPNRVMSTANAVAGTDSVAVAVAGTSYDAHVVSYDPSADISILDVPKLTAPPLAFEDSPASGGTDAVMLGYPQLQSFAATPARIAEMIRLNGPDIYGTTTVIREVYTFKSIEEVGDSGGPLIDVNGRVLGVDFGSAGNDPNTGFALTAREIAPQMAKVAN